LISQRQKSAGDRAPSTDTDDHVASALRTLDAEIEGLRALQASLGNSLGHAFGESVAIITGTPGRVAVTGIGKSGHIARKIASTLSSTGQPAFFLHPAEASHGDLGMVTSGDVVLALSWSGETPELRDVIHHAKRFHLPLIAITSDAQSALGRAADVALALPKSREACSVTQAPTTSTTMQMAFGDALAIALLEARGFSATDFRTFHPGGRLGARLITVRDVMIAGEHLPSVSSDASLAEAIFAITRTRCGGVGVVDGDGRLIGAFTDGDLRRILAKADLAAPVVTYMNASPVFVDPSLLATEALRDMNERERPILLLFVCEGGRLVGAVHLHDLLRVGVV
jgi:arabinose-5-phosphate isomerase